MAPERDRGLSDTTKTQCGDTYILQFQVQSKNREVVSATATIPKLAISQENIPNENLNKDINMPDKELDKTTEYSILKTS